MRRSKKKMHGSSSFTEEEWKEAEAMSEMAEAEAAKSIASIEATARAEVKEKYKSQSSSFVGCLMSRLFYLTLGFALGVLSFSCFK